MAACLDAGPLLARHGRPAPQPARSRGALVAPPRQGGCTSSNVLMQVIESPYQLQLVGGGGPLHASALQTMLKEIEEAAEAHTQAKMR